MTRPIELVDVLLAALAEIRAEQQQLGRQIGRHIEMMGAAMGFAAAAHYLGVSERTIARWVADGRLPLVPHTDRRRLIARVELDRFAEGGRTPGLRVVASSPLSSVSSALAVRRRELRLSMREAASRGGISPQTWSALEGDTPHPPSMATQRGVAKALSWPIDWLDEVGAGRSVSPVVAQLHEVVS